MVDKWWTKMVDEWWEWWTNGGQMVDKWTNDPAVVGWMIELSPPAVLRNLVCLNLVG